MKPWILPHQKVLSDQYRQNILPHAILINGVTGSGKLEIAHWFLSLLSCQQPTELDINNSVLESCGLCKHCLLVKSNTYPDHLNVIAEKNNLGVDDIRFANTFLQKKSHTGKYQTVLIEHAQTMTQSAANALLKTLEEPSDNSVIVLLTNDVEMMLPTIISRCRVLNLRPEVGSNLLNGMSNKTLDIGRGIYHNSAYVNLTQLPELTDDAINKNFQEFQSCYITSINEKTLDHQLLDLLLKNEQGLRWLEQITVNLHRDQLLASPISPNNSKLYTELLNKLYKVIINGCKVIKLYTQSNKQFVCEQLIMSINEVLEQFKANDQEIKFDPNLH